MDLRAFSAENRERCEAPDGFNHPIGAWSLSDWMVAVTGEVGEAANIIKKMNRCRDGIQNRKGETMDTLRPALAKEIADAAIYLDLLAQAAGLDLSTCIREKFDETSREIGYLPADPSNDDCSAADFFNEDDPDGYDVDGTGKPGISLAANAIQFWSLRLGRETTIAEAAAAFQMPRTAVESAVAWHPFMFVGARNTIEHDGE
jgi:NTP pyrophosphatase (non-canonical NTP hydrolase)